VPTGGLPYSQFNYTLNENGEDRDYGSADDDYLTDVLAAKAAAVISNAAASGRPFFLYLAPYAPHEPARPAPRHAALFADLRAPRPPSYNEEDVGDKPRWIQALVPLDERRGRNLDGLYRNKARSMASVDEMLAALVEQLASLGQLDNTYVVFTSDNGFHIGTHRLPSGKYTPYEEDIHVPLIIRGPGVAKGAGTAALASNIDLAPTLAQLAGVQAPSFVDGRSLVALFGGVQPATWRTALLYEQGSREIQNEEARGNQGAEPRTTTSVVIPDLRAIRTGRYMYVEYSTGDRELYDLAVDPFELENIAGTAPAELIEALSARVTALSACRESGCRTAENAPAPD
jgi:arylsulfatase A-like enzyme